MKLTTFMGLAFASISAVCQAQTTPKFEVTPESSTIKFFVKSSIDLEGSFDKWDATLTFNSTAATSGVLDIKIQAATVDTGSGMKDGKLRSKDFFDVKQDPLITFHSTKVTHTAPHRFSVEGTFTIRGISKTETLTMKDTHDETGLHEIKGVMAFDRKDFGMNSGIPFIKIADRVEVTVDLRARQVGGPLLVYQ